MTGWCWYFLPLAFWRHQVTSFFHHHHYLLLLPAPFSVITTTTTLRLRLYRYCYLLLLLLYFYYYCSIVTSSHRHLSSLSVQLLVQAPEQTESVRSDRRESTVLTDADWFPLQLHPWLTVFGWAPTTNHTALLIFNPALTPFLIHPTLFSLISTTVYPISFFFLSSLF